MTITLRERQLESGNKTLYLDIYDKGERKNLYLDLYLIPEVDNAAKRINAGTMKKAREMRSQFL